MVSHASSDWNSETAEHFCQLEKRARALVFGFICDNQGNDIPPAVSIGLIRAAVVSAGTLFRFAEYEHANGRCQCDDEACE